MDWLGFFLPQVQTYSQTPAPIINEVYRKSNEYIPEKRIIIIQDGKNFTHNHTFTDAENHTWSIQHTHPYYGEHYHEPSSYYNNPVDNALTSLSSWYQMNMGLIGIGALAVVAIIGSRNFFGNYLAEKYPFGVNNRFDSFDRADYNDYDRRYDHEYDHGYGSFDRDSWYEDWYDQWYRDNAEQQQPNEDEYDYNSYDRDHDNDIDNYKQYYERYKRDLRQGDWDNTTISNYAAERFHRPRRRYNTTRLSLPPGSLTHYSASPRAHVPHINAHCRFLIACHLAQKTRSQLSKQEMAMLTSIK